jgi:hypothetical protein
MIEILLPCRITPDFNLPKIKAGIASSYGDHDHLWWDLTNQIKKPENEENHFRACELNQL